VIWMTQSLLIGKVPGAKFLDALLSRGGLVVGAALTVAGYAGTLWCYAAMGDSWRIGINSGEKNALVDCGPYRFVRHPIYLFQIVMLAGGVLLLPTVLSCAILLIHLVCVLIKAVDEETYLLSVHGDAYRDFMGRTGRLLPKLW
jgi:protein-S-isoprenylcysteine O-methyltransferase Ste14